MERFNFWITLRNKKILASRASFNGQSMGDIINSLIEKHIDDPREFLKEEIRKRAKEINMFQDQLKAYQKDEDDKNPQSHKKAK